MKNSKPARKSTAVAVTGFIVLLLLGFVQMSAKARQSSGKEAHIEGNLVYVCSCLKTQSCSCMTEAKTEGPCSCGTEGGPPMKPVPSNSAWAKANRRALAK